MIRGSLTSAAAAIGAGLIVLAAVASRAQGLREFIDAIVADDLGRHSGGVGDIVAGRSIMRSDAIGEALGQTPYGESPPNPARTDGAFVSPVVDRSAVAHHAGLLFSSAHQVTLGNPEGDVTLVEFFDYNCGYCRRALRDMLALMRDDPKLKVVLKESPILGPGSIEAARVAIAVRMQDPRGQKYLAFHRELLGARGPAGEDKALAAANDHGLDMTSLKHDMASDEVRATIAEDLQLARALGIAGTPGYVIGNTVVIGAVGYVALKARIDAARGQRTD